MTDEEEVIKFVGLSKRDSIRKAVGYYHKHHLCARNIEEFLAKCRLQKDGITIHFYPKMNVDMSKYRAYVERLKQKEKDEDKFVAGHRWSISKFLCWLRGLFK